MSVPQLKTIRPLIHVELANIVDYFLSLSPKDDERMGTDRKNLPAREEWIQMLIEDSHQPIEQRQFYYLGFFLDNTAIGHAGINKINFGNEAYIHFHIWKPQLHRQGLGRFYLKEAVQYYFNHFKLKKIICEPNVENIAPNKTLLKSGFTLCDTYRIKPSILSFEHAVNRYEIEKDCQ
jgi:RimJ/RimL family protein N-acetyltransferase